MPSTTHQSLATQAVEKPLTWSSQLLVATGMGHYIVEYVKGCDLCNHKKKYLAPVAGKIMPNHIPDHHWQIISVDLITELP